MCHCLQPLYCRQGCITVFSLCIVDRAVLLSSAFVLYTWLCYCLQPLYSLYIVDRAVLLSSALYCRQGCATVFSLCIVDRAALLSSAFVLYIGLCYCLQPLYCRQGCVTVFSLCIVDRAVLLSLLSRREKLDT